MTTPDEIRTAERLLRSLEADHDLEAYWTDANALSEKVKKRQEEAAQKLEEEAERLRESAESVRRGEAPAPEEDREENEGEG